MESREEPPYQGPDMGRSADILPYLLFRAMYYHELPSGNQHPYVLKSQYGKVSRLLSPYPGRHVNVATLWQCLRRRIDLAPIWGASLASICLQGRLASTQLLFAFCCHLDNLS